MMKKTFANIRALAAVLIASAALAACSNEDSGIITEQPAQPQAPKTYTLTLQAGKADGAQTRALKLETSGALTAYWENGDELTVLNDTKGVALTGTLTAKDVSDGGKTCTFSGTLTGEIEAGHTLLLSYHAQTGLSDYTSQTGTLASAAEHDYAVAPVTVASVNGGNITITETSAEFETQTAVLKITMKDKESNNPLNASRLIINVGNDGAFTFDVPDGTYTTNKEEGVLYFALPSATFVATLKGMTKETLANQDIFFFANVGTDTYRVTKTGYTLEASQYYTTTLTMENMSEVSE